MKRSAAVDADGARRPAGADCGQGVMDLGDLASTQEMGLAGPDYWTYAQLKDWILLNPEIPHAEVRVYGILRSLVTRWLNDQKVTKDRLRFICPGVNGKPMGERTFDGVLKSLAARKLISVSAGGAVASRSSATGRFERSEQLLLRVHELPAEGFEFAGFHTVREAYEAYPGPGWDVDQKAQTSRSRRMQKTAAGGHRAQKTADGADRAQKTAHIPIRPEQGKQSVSAGQAEGHSAQFSAVSAQKTALLDPLGLGKEGAPNVFPNTDGVSVRPFRTARTTTAAAVRTDGRTETPPEGEPADQSQPGRATGPAAGVSLAATLVTAAPVQADLRRIDLLPAVKHRQRNQLAQLVGAIDRALLRFPEAKVARYLAERAAAAHTVKFLLAAFTEYSDAIHDVHVPDLNDPRDATVLAKAAGSATPKPPAPPEPAPEHDLASPVTWLTDAQFAALSHQDRAHIRVAAETPVEQLRPKAAVRVAAIRQATETVVA